MTLPPAPPNETPQERRKRRYEYLTKRLHEDREAALHRGDLATVARITFTLEVADEWFEENKNAQDHTVR